MTNPIKLSARLLYSEGKFLEAYQTLETLGYSEFCDSIFNTKKHNWYLTIEGRSTFWNEYIPKSVYFKELFGGEWRHTLLLTFFKFWDRNGTELIKRLADEYPEFLIHGIRIHTAFLAKDAPWLIDFLISHPNPRLKTHGLFIQLILKDEEKLWNIAKEKLELIDKNITPDLLIEMSFWLEKKQSEQKETDGIARVTNNNLDILSECLAKMINYLGLNPKKNLFDENASAKMAECFAEGLISHAKTDNKKSNIYFEALEAIQKQTVYVFSVIDCYAFDNSFDIKTENDCLILFCKNINENKKKIYNGIKNKTWLSLIDYSAKLQADSLLKNSDTLFSRFSGEQKELKITTLRNNLGMKMLAREVHIDDINERKYSADDIMLMLSTIFSNARKSFVEPRLEFYKQKPGKWEAFLVNRVRDDIKPLTFYSEETMRNHILKAVASDMNPKELQEVYSIISQNKILPKFDRFHCKLILNSPYFLRIGDYFIAFTALLGNIEPLIAFLDNQLGHTTKMLIPRDNNETKNMERRLALRFIRIGFNNIVYSKGYDKNGLKGDFDVLVFHKGTLLVIELKRNKLRFNLGDAWDERTGSTLHALRQTKRAIKYIQTEFADFKEKFGKSLGIENLDQKDLKIVPLIVSTTFNDDHEYIENEVLKISYFEISTILYAYWMKKKKGSHNLEDIINDLETDKLWSKMKEFSTKIPDPEPLIFRLM